MIGDLRRVLSNIRVEDGREALAPLFVNPASAFVFVVANLLLRRSGSSFAALVNPWELTLGLWLAGWLAVRLALLGFVDWERRSTARTLRINSRMLYGLTT